MLPKYTDCTTYNGSGLYLMCCGFMLLLLITHIYLYNELWYDASSTNYTYIYIFNVLCDASSTNDIYMQVSKVF